MQHGRVACEDIHWDLDVLQLRLFVFPVRIHEGISLDHLNNVFSVVFPVEFLHEQIPEPIVRDPTATYAFAVEVADTFPRGDRLQMWGLLGRDEPV